jgi:selenocysteine-specific elongation factor
VRLHHGTVEVMARISLINSLESSDAGQTPDSRLQTPDSIEPGQNDLVQLRLEEPIVALPGDRFIIRSYSPQITIGGGVILDAFPEKHRLRDREAKATLHKLENAKDFVDRAGIFIEMRGTHAMSASELATRTGATDEQLSEIAKDLLAAKRVIEIPNSPMMLMSRSAFDTLASEVLELLASHHKHEPLSLGINREEVRERLFSSLRPEIFRTVITKLVDEKKIVADRDALRLAAHKPALNDADEKAKMALEAALKAAGLQALTLDEAATSVKIPVTLARKFYNLLLAEKRIVRAADFVFHADVIEELKNRVRAYKAKNSRIDVAAFKEISGGLSRKHAIPLLEFLDSERITRRVGNEREIL